MNLKVYPPQGQIQGGAMSKIEIDVHSFVMFISDIRGDLFVQLMFCIYYQKCSQTMSKWNANENLISFGPKYLLKMVRYKNVIKDLDILLKSSLKMQEMPF